MSGDEHRDGNAMGGLLLDVFGREMTDVRGRCAHCHHVNPIGAMLVYDAGPGQVLRCPDCSTVVIVATPRPTGTRVYFSQVSWIQTAD